MHAVKCSEICSNSPGDRQCLEHLQRAAQGHGDAGQLTERRNHVLKKQLPSTEGNNGELLYLFSLYSNSKHIDFTN